MAREVAIRFRCLGCGQAFNVWRKLPPRGEPINLTKVAPVCPGCEVDAAEEPPFIPLSFLNSHADTELLFGGSNDTF